MLVIGTYNDAFVQRLVGGLTIAGSLGIGALLIAADKDGADNSLFWAGLITAGAGTVIGAVTWAIAGDSADVIVRSD